MYHTSLTTSLQRTLDDIFNDLQPKGPFRARELGGEGVELPLPGVKASDLDVEFRPGQLKIQWKERDGRFLVWKTAIPSEVEGVDASYEDGLLTILYRRPEKKDEAVKVPVRTA